MTHRINPWQVWWTNFDPQVGREQAGRRPAIIVGSALACSLPNDLVIVVPVTKTDRGLPFHPAITLGNQHCVAMTDQVKSISRVRLLSRHKHDISDEEIERIRFSLRQMINIL